MQIIIVLLLAIAQSRPPINALEHAFSSTSNSKSLAAEIVPLIEAAHVPNSESLSVVAVEASQKVNKPHLETNGQVLHKSSTILPLHEAVEVSNAIPNSVLAAEAAKNGKTSRLEKIDTALTVASKIMRGDNQAAKQLAYWYRITEYLKKGKGMLQLGAGDDMLNLAAMGPFISFLNTDAQKVMCGILLCTNVAKLAVKAAKGELRSENRDVSVVAQELIQNFGPSVAYVPEGLMKDIALAMIMLTHLATVPKNMLK